MLKCLKRNICLVLLIGLGIVSGCNSVSKLNRAEIASVKKTFTKLARAMTEGDLETAYSLLSATYKMQVSYDDFVSDYKANQDYLVIRYHGAFLLHTAIEENEATSLVKFGTGEKKIAEFIKEDNIWKLNRMGEKVIIPPR